MNDCKHSPPGMEDVHPDLRGLRLATPGVSRDHQAFLMSCNRRSRGPIRFAGCPTRALFDFSPTNDQMSCDFLRCSRPLQEDGTGSAAVNYQRWQLLQMTNLCQLWIELRDRPNGLVIEN